jgi:elongation factor P hydroxylase
MDHHELAARINRAIARPWATVVIGGAEEPLYLPGTPGRPAVIRYTRDHAQSVLHELAHWCIAGRARRALPDYGYDYEPPPRNARSRARFLAVEARVQALELLFACTARVRFHVSPDDPGHDPMDLSVCVAREGAVWLRHGFPLRTRAVLAALHADWAPRLACDAPSWLRTVAESGCAPDIPAGCGHG